MYVGGYGDMDMGGDCVGVGFLCVVWIWWFMDMGECGYMRVDM